MHRKGHPVNATKVVRPSPSVVKRWRLTPKIRATTPSSLFIFSILVLGPQDKHDASPDVHSTGVHWIEQADDIIGGHENLACLEEPTCDAEPDIVVAAGHYSIGGAHIELVEEITIIRQGKGGAETTAIEPTLHLCTKTVVDIEVIVATKQKIGIQRGVVTLAWCKLHLEILLQGVEESSR